MKKRGQISIEYLIVVGFVTFIVIAVLGVSYFYASSIRDQIKSSQISSFAEKIIVEAEKVYYASEPSKSTISVYLPAGINSITIEEQNMIISYQSSSGTTISAFKSNVPIEITTTITEGPKRLSITAQSSVVSIIQT